MEHKPQNSAQSFRALCGELQMPVVWFRRLQSLSESKQCGAVVVLGAKTNSKVYNVHVISVQSLLYATVKYVLRARIFAIFYVHIMFPVVRAAPFAKNVACRGILSHYQKCY